MKDGQTIGQWLKWDFEANGYLEIKDKNGKLIYYENLYNNWAKREYDSKGNQIYFENSDGYWVKWEYDSQGKEIYYENSNGYWAKYEYNSQGIKIYFENSDGEIIDKRPKPCEGKIVEVDGVKYKLTKV